MGATELWLIRHGESVANVAAAEAERAAADRLTVAYRDADVPLSVLGTEQAESLGNWLAESARGRQGLRVWTSSYRRASQTIALALGEAGIQADVRTDERLRDRELGILDLLTSSGVENVYPQEAERRRWLGKFYYRPPGGESWADVALRVRSLLDEFDLAVDRDADLAAASMPVVVATHDAVVMLFLYVCTSMSEAELLEFSRTHTVTNASVTRLIRPAGQGVWSLDLFSHDAHLEASGVPVTDHSGDKDADIH